MSRKLQVFLSIKSSVSTKICKAKNHIVDIINYNGATISVHICALTFYSLNVVKNWPKCQKSLSRTDATRRAENHKNRKNVEKFESYRKFKASTLIYH